MLANVYATIAKLPANNFSSALVVGCLSSRTSGLPTRTICSVSSVSGPRVLPLQPTSLLHCIPSHENPNLFFEKPSSRISTSIAENTIEQTVLPFVVRLPASVDDSAFLPTIELPGLAKDPVKVPSTPSTPHTDVLLPGSASQIIETPGHAANGTIMCIRYPRRRRKNQGLFERWWLEHDPPRNNYISGKGRGPHKGHSINKKDWPRQMPPILEKKRWKQLERNRYAFRKHGYDYDIPTWGG